MNTDVVYQWYIEHGKFDNELLSTIQLECFNKKVNPVKIINYIRLQNMLSSDKRFNDERLALRWWWIFDLEYAVIDKSLLVDIVNQVRDIGNVWTMVSIVQSVTGLNCGFVGLGSLVANGEITDKEVEVCGFLVDDGMVTEIVVFDENGKEVKEGEVVIGFAIFD